MSADWFCRVGDKQVGPLSSQQLKALVAKGKLRPEYPLRRGNEGPWIPAGRVKGLFPEGPAAAHGGRTASAKKTPSKAAPQPAEGAKTSKAAKGGDPPRAAKALPTADAAPQPPAADLPTELSLGGHKKHHAEMNFDQFNIDSAPLPVTRKPGPAIGLKKAQQKKANTILLCVAGGAMLIALIMLIVGASQGMLSGLFSSHDQEAAKKDETKSAEELLSTEKTSEEKSAKDKTPAEEKDEEWVLPLRPITRNNIDVKVKSAVLDAPPEDSRVDKEEHPEVAIVTVTLKHTNGDAEDDVPLKNWKSMKSSVVLKDDGHERYDLLDTLIKDDAKSIKPKAATAVQVQLIFAAPEAKPKYLRLELPASVFGGEGMLRFEIPRKSITGGAKKAKPAADSASESDAQEPPPKRPPKKLELQEEGDIGLPDPDAK